MTVRMQRLSLVCVALFFLLVAVGLERTRPAALAQDDDSVLQTAVADLQTRVAALETRVAASAGTALPAQIGAVATPVTVVSNGGTPTPGGIQATVSSVSAAPLAGEVPSSLSAGEEGVVAVIAVGSPVGSSVPVVVRNNTGSDVLLSDVLGIARDAAGALIASGEVSTFSPYLVPAGQVAVGSVYFGTTDLPPDATFEFEPAAQPADTGRAFRQDLEIKEVTFQEGRIIGLARNGTDQPLQGPFSVVGVCFDAEGTVRGYYSTYAAKNSLSPDETTAFDASFYGEGPCDGFLIGSNGFRPL